jgi:hypothetical protein
MYPRAACCPFAWSLVFGFASAEQVVIVFLKSISFAAITGNLVRTAQSDLALDADSIEHAMDVVIGAAGKDSPPAYKATSTMA